MDKSEHIQIPRKPSPYRPRLSLDRPQYSWRSLSILLAVLGVITGVIWWTL